MATPRAQATPAKGRVQWNDELRTALWVMVTDLHYDSAQLVKVFNALFKEYLRECKVYRTVEFPTLSSQFKSLRGDRQKSRHIRSPSSTGAKAQRAHLILGIQSIAATLAASDNPDNGKPRRGRPPMELRTTDLLTSQSRKRTAPDTDNLQPQPKRSNRKLSKRPRLDTVRVQATVLAEVPLTPPKTPIQRRPHATVLYTTPAGYSVWITPEQYARTQEDLLPASSEEVHPPVPGLLFRSVCEQRPHLTHG